MQKKLSKEELKLKEQEQKLYEEKLVKEVYLDFENRRKMRKPFDRQWELNMNFLAGNQYCDINSRGEIENESKVFYWQNRAVFNHIAPLIDARTSKFSRLNANVSVRPKSDDDKDVAGASLAEKLIATAFEKVEFDKVVKKVTMWSETCGTGFYKVLWNNQGGNQIGEVNGNKVYEGDIIVLPVSPFEIFPDSLYSEEIKDCQSIIHARAIPTSTIYEKYGVIVKGEKVSVYGLSNTKGALNGNEDYIEDAVVLIEKYEKPTKDYPNGRLIIVADNTLLYNGDLPYVNGKSGERGYPFVKQQCLVLSGRFFGVSIVDRLIPIQRAFNAVKNRKHEFINRLSMGVMAVEDGSVDIDDLNEDGLSPGKVLVYRQGSKAPEIMANMAMPNDFNQEEEKLINEFVIVSGVSDVTSSASNATLSSGTALQILVEQDNEKLIMTAEEIRRCILEVAKKIIWLYAQFAEGVRIVKYMDGNNKTKILYADKNAVNSDEVYLESENELLYTHSQRKAVIFDLYKSGILLDEDGKIRPSTKEKILALLGYKDLDYQKGLSRLHEEKAIEENELLLKDNVEVDNLDQDTIHIDEHTRYFLSEYKNLEKEQKQRFYNHIEMHNQKINMEKEEKLINKVV